MMMKVLEEIPMHVMHVLMNVENRNFVEGYIGEELIQLILVDLFEE
jgi:hypothetical protein